MCMIDWEKYIFNIIMAIIAILSLLYNCIITSKNFKIKKSDLYYSLLAEFEILTLQIEKSIKQLNYIKESENKLGHQNTNHQRIIEGGLESYTKLLNQLNIGKETLVSISLHIKHERLHKMKSNLKQIKSAKELNDTNTKEFIRYYKKQFTI